MPIIHLLSGAGGELRQATIACGSRTAQQATWSRAAVTCPQCLDLGPRVLKPHNPTTLQPTTIQVLREKAWLAQVRQLARANGFLTYHTLRSHGSEAGWIDLVCLKPPVLWLVEVKTQTGRLTPQQAAWLEGLQQVTTVHSALWRPGDWPTILALLR